MNYLTVYFLEVKFALRKDGVALSRFLDKDA